MSLAPNGFESGVGRRGCVVASNLCRGLFDSISFSISFVGYTPDAPLRGQVRCADFGARKLRPSAVWRRAGGAAVVLDGGDFLSARFWS